MTTAPITVEITTSNMDIAISTINDYCSTTYHNYAESRTMEPPNSQSVNKYIFFDKYTGNVH